MALNLLQEYLSSDDDDDGSDSGSEATQPRAQAPAPAPAPSQTQRRSPQRQTHSSSESDSESDSESSDSELEVTAISNAPRLEIPADWADDAEENDPNKKMPIKAIGEIGIEDLPPIEELSISVPQQMCEHLGNVSNIVDTLVIIESLTGLPALDLETVLFLECGQKTLGIIFDVFGQVDQPFYCVRFNSREQIDEKSVTIGTAVYCAPRTQHTKVVCIPLLVKSKGCDASWEHDIEPPKKYLDYSDDEEERKARRASKASKRAERRSGLTEFEKKMNERNLRKTAEYRRTFADRPSVASYANNNTNPWVVQGATGFSNNNMYRLDDNYNSPNLYSAARWSSGYQPYAPTVPFATVSPFLRPPVLLPPPPPPPPLPPPPFDDHSQSRQ